MCTVVPAVKCNHRASFSNLLFYGELQSWSGANGPPFDGSLLLCTDKPGAANRGPDPKHMIFNIKPAVASSRQGSELPLARSHMGLELRTPLCGLKRDKS
jgi:hypothetical protein